MLSIGLSVKDSVINNYYYIAPLRRTVTASAKDIVSHRVTETIRIAVRVTVGDPIKFSVFKIGNKDAMSTLLGQK